MRAFPLLFIPLAFIVVPNNNIDKSATGGYESITAADLRKHLIVLASDSLEGRETSFPGQRKAARYIATEFTRLGLKPAGDNGTFFQRFQLELSRPSNLTKLAVHSGKTTKTYEWGKDFISTMARDTTLSGSAAFIGFMDTRFDETTQKQLSGRIVVAFAGQREFARDTSTEQFGRKSYSFRLENDLAAIFIVTDDAGAFTFQKAAARFLEINESRRGMTLRGTPRPPARSPLPIFISPWMASELLRNSKTSLAKLRTQAATDSVFKPLFLAHTRVTMESKVLKEIRESENVIGMMEGSDAQLKEQVVVFTAHYDHLGKASDGRIFYGADDDGSGTATVIELAEAFVTNSVKPKRSLIFMTVSGEEKGLLGSRYYVSHPIVPLERTIANLNIDMIGRVDVKHDKENVVNYTYVIGSDKISTELDSLLRIANNESEQLALDYTFNDENDPNRFYRRSDHFNFARNGIPVIFFFTGVHADYHRPTDTVDKIMFEKMQLIARLVYYTGWKVANFGRLLAKNVAVSGYN